MNSNYKFIIYLQVMLRLKKRGFRLLRAPQLRSKSYKSTFLGRIQRTVKIVSLTRQRYSQALHMPGISLSLFIFTD